MSKKTESLSHELKPEHRLLSDEEKRKVLEKYRTSLALMPRILHTDRGLDDLDVKPGDMVLIKRKDEVGEFDYYRVVVKN